jgi:hypothetical protein
MCHLIAGLIDSTLSDDQVYNTLRRLNFIEERRSRIIWRMRSNAGVNFETRRSREILFYGTRLFESVFSLTAPWAVHEACQITGPFTAGGSVPVPYTSVG